jgi:hypothetical protein
MTATLVTLRAWTFWARRVTVLPKGGDHETQDQHQVRPAALDRRLRATPSATLITPRAWTSGLLQALLIEHHARREDPMQRKTNVKAGGYAIRGV